MIYLIFNFVHVLVCGCAHELQVPMETEERQSLKLELQMIENHLAWILGTKLKPYVREIVVLNH